MRTWPIHLLAWATALCAVSLCWAAEPKPALGLATGDYPFLINNFEIRRNGTLLEGENVSAHYLPVWLELSDGARYVLGVGSLARLWSDRVELEGVSLEMVGGGDSGRAVIAGGLRFVPRSVQTQALFYTDRADAVSVFVAEGELEAFQLSGEQAARMTKNQSATFSRTLTSPRLQETRAPLEIARIQLRQIRHLEELARIRPQLLDRTAELVDLLTRASGGLLDMRDESAAGTSITEIPTGLPAIDAELLLGATVETARRINRSVDWHQYGCGAPSCASEKPLRKPHIFVGNVGGLPPQPPGCVLCRASAPPRP